MPPRRAKPVAKKIPKAKETPSAPEAKAYHYPTAESPARPAAGAQARFKQKKLPKEYAYDSSLAPELNWDAGNAAVRDRAESLIAAIKNAKSLDDARAAAGELSAMSKPFLNWAGKKERLSFDVPTLPLFVHERLSTKAVLDSVRDKQKATDQFDFLTQFGDPRHSVADQVLRAYQHQDPWTNRMILGDSLVVMNSLLEYEGMGGKVQMIYIDPPYGVKYNSNFQPFVGKRDVKHGDDADLTREPEMVQAYRDTWELGLHSYLSYLRDRLMLARELLTASGSVFVQISDENVHHVREMMDEVFGSQNAIALIGFQKTTGQASEFVSSTFDYLVWYARDKTAARGSINRLFTRKVPGEAGATEYNKLELADGSIRQASREEVVGTQPLPIGARLFSTYSLFSAGNGKLREFSYTTGGREILLKCPSGYHFKTGDDPSRLQKLVDERRLVPETGQRVLKRYLDDFPFSGLTNLWTDTRGEPSMTYVVQTAAKVIERCLLMTTRPGDLVLDPTCGSGTTAHVAEQWGRRWITIDTSRVPLALARQRLLTATFDWYQLRDDTRGPAGGFLYKRHQNAKGEEVGGVVPRVTVKSIADGEPPREEVLVDRPEIGRGVVRITGPFTVEATIPTPVDIGADRDEASRAVPEYGDWVERVINILRRSPTLHLGANRTIELAQLRPPARTLALSAEAMVEGKPIAIVIGPEHGSVGERQVSEAGREAYQKGYKQLLVVGLAIEPNARALVEAGEAVMGVQATYVQATPDLLMGDLLKTMRSSQIFSVCGLPDIEVGVVKAKSKADATRWQVTLKGLDIFDPVTMQTDASPGERVPCWMLDQDYDGLVFHGAQVFFPRTQAWDALQRSLKADFDPSVWEHLAGTTSTPFSAPEGKQEFTIAVKVIDPRGNELLVTREVKR